MAINRIDMKTRLTPDITIDEMVATRPRAANLIASIGMNPEKHTSDTIRTICQQRQWNEVELIDWINKQLASEKNGEADRSKNDSNGMSLSRWSDHLIELIQRNQELLNEVRADFRRVHEIHGNQYTWLKGAAWYVHSLHERYRLYSDFERKTFLPNARSLDFRNETVSDGLVKNLQHGCDILESDRAEMLDYMSKIREMSSNFRNPDGACSTLRILNQKFISLFELLMRQFDLEQDMIPQVREKVAAL